MTSVGHFGPTVSLTSAEAIMAPNGPMTQDPRGLS
jgi:hypothetical protein